MYAEQKTCTFFQFEVYSLSTNEVIQCSERGIVYEGAFPTWEQLLGATAEILSVHDDISDYKEVEETKLGFGGKYWITAQYVNDDPDCVVRIRRPVTPPPSPMR
jgi:hypothetical protein